MGTVPKPSRDPVEFKPMAAETSGLSTPEPEVPSHKDTVYEELRELILAPEQRVLEQLRHRVDDPESRTEDVGGVVAEAIHLRRQRGGDEAPCENRCAKIQARWPTPCFRSWDRPSGEASWRHCALSLSPSIKC